MVDFSIQCTIRHENAAQEFEFVYYHKSTTTYLDAQVCRWSLRISANDQYLCLSSADDQAPIRKDSVKQSQLQLSDLQHPLKSMQCHQRTWGSTSTAHLWVSGLASSPL